MQSQKLRFLVTLQRRVDNQAPSGQVVHSVEDVADVWAEIMPGRGREFFAAAQIQAAAIAEIRIRYRDDIDETWKVKYIKRHDEPQLIEFWDVAAPPVADAKTGREDLLLYCTKGTAEGWRTS